MFNKITKNIYIRHCEGYTDRPNIGLVVGEKYTLLFDAGNSAAHVELMKRELKEQGLPHPDAVVLSHWHWDHSFGAGAWGVPIIAGQKTNEQLKNVQKWHWDDASMEERIKNGEDIAFCTEMIKREYPERDKISVAAADIVFSDRLALDFGGVTCELIHSKGPHSEDSVICYVSSEKFLFLGDANCKDLYGKPWHFDIEHEEDFMQNVAAIPYDRALVNEFLALLDTLDFELCASGHCEPMSKKELYESLSE